MIVPSVVACFFSFFFVTVFSRTIKDEIKSLQTKSGRILIGTLLGDVSLIRMGTNEGGNINAVLEPYFGEMVMKLGKAYVDFPSCPAVHLSFNLGLKQHVNAATLLLRLGADPNIYRLPSNKTSKYALIDRGYPPALLYALGLGQEPHISHAAMLQRLLRTYTSSFNISKIEQWRLETGNPPLTHLCMLLDNTDGAHVLLTELGLSVDERDEYGLTALHVAVWRQNIPGMVMLLQQGASALSTDKFGRTALHYAVMRGLGSAFAKILLTSAIAEANKRMPMLPAPSRRKATEEQVNEVKRKLLSTKDSFGETALDMAATAPVKMALRDFLRDQLLQLNMSTTTPLPQQEAGPERNAQVGDVSRTREEQTHRETDSLRIYEDGGWSGLTSSSSSPASHTIRELFSCSTGNDTVETLDAPNVTTLEDLQNLHLNGEDSILVETLSSAEVLRNPDIFLKYFSAQRPVLFDEQLTSGTGIWAHWMKQEFLERYGSLQVTVGLDLFKEKEWEKERAEEATLSKPPTLMTCCRGNGSALSVDNSEGLFCGKKLEKRHKKVKVSLREYVRNCMSPSPSPSPSPSLPHREETESSRQQKQKQKKKQSEPFGCYWGADAEDASLQLPTEFALDLPVPAVFNGLCATQSPMPSTSKKHDDNMSAQAYGDAVVSVDDYGTATATETAPPPPNTDADADATGVREERVEPLQVHLGGPLSGTTLRTHNASWNLLLTGHKKWFLLPPGFDVHEGAKPTCRIAVPGASRSGGNETASVESAPAQCLLPVRDWLRQAVPQWRWQNAVVELVQNPGEVLFVPHDWQYATLSLSDTVAVSQHFCTILNSDARVHPLGNVIYGGVDPHRGLGMFKLHRKSTYKIGIERPKVEGVPVLDFPAVT